MLSADHCDWLRQMPSGPILPDGDSVSCMHGSVLDEDEYVMTVRDAWMPLRTAATRINFFGHTHLQGGFATNGPDWFRLIPRYGSRKEAEEFELPLRGNVRYLVNPGSVGQPRDGDWRAAFAIFDDTENLLTFCRVPYDVKRAQQGILDAGLPDRLAVRLREGR
jgi:diadenosine tetraphosphatase ApaH/serine/threonine PP2A family protein phosphatase